MVVFGWAAMAWCNPPCCSMMWWLWSAASAVASNLKVDRSNGGGGVLMMCLMRAMKLDGDWTGDDGGYDGAPVCW